MAKPIAYSPNQPNAVKSALGERLVIDAARDLVKRHPNHPDFKNLEDAVRVLDTLEGR